MAGKELGITRVNGLPTGLERLIRRKLRFVRREVDARFVDSATAASRKITEQVPVCIRERRIGWAIAGVPKEAYADMVKRATDETKVWAKTVWEVIRSSLELAQVVPSDSRVIIELIEEFAWSGRKPPFPLKHLDSERFKGMVMRTLRNHGLDTRPAEESLERALRHSHGMAEVSILNSAARAREAVEIAVDEYLLQHASGPPGPRRAEQGTDAERLPRGSSRHARRDTEIRAKYEELAQLGRRNYVKEIKRTVRGADLLTDRRIRAIVRGR